MGEKTAAKLINEYGDLDTLFDHLDALSPKLRENLAAHAERVRINAEVIPLVRDVPLDVHVDDLALGGWDADEARATFDEFELRTVWPRFSSLMGEGAFGPSSGGDIEGLSGGGSAGGGSAGGGSAGGGSAGGGSAGPGGATGGATGGAAAAGMPEWLAEPEVQVPTTAASAREALEQVFAAATASTGAVAVLARWSGDPGRSPVASLTVSCEAVPGEKPPAIVHIGPDEDGVAALLADPGVLEALAAGFGPGGVGVVAHDAKEMMRSLLPLGVDITGLTMDTAVVAYLLDPSVDRYRLADLASRYLEVTVDDGTGGKGQGTFALGDATDEPERDDGIGEEDLRAIRLAAVLARLRPPLAGALAAVGEDALYRDIEQPLVRVLARMEVVGIPVDRVVLRSIAAGLAEECASLELTIQDLAGTPFKVNSVPQLRTVLYDTLGLTPVRKTKTGFSTDARTLELLRGQHPIIEALLRYREVEKLRSTYGESLAAEVADDGRIHATFRQTVARTGRLSSDRPNLHNIPVRTEEGRRFREAFVPSPGRRLLVADYDQVELRAIAHLSGDPGLSAAFAAGEDIHRTVASQVFAVERDEVTHAQRSTAKMVSYGLAYGMEAYGLSQRLGVPVDEAQVILLAFFTAFPSVREYMERAVSEARSAGFTVTAFGRRRPLPDLISTNYQVRQAAERQAMNAGIQGLAADLFKVALIRLDAGLEEGGLASDLVLQVHDEVLVDVVPEEADEVAILTEQALTGAADLSVPLKVAMAWGSSWAEAKEG